MKIISWNCNMAFRKKFEKIMRQNPDLLVLQECENDLKLKTHLASINYNQLIWYGKNPHKGIAVLSFNDLNIELNQNLNPEYEYIIPFKLQIGKRNINLFNVWAMPHKRERKKDYVGQIWGAINYYTTLLNEPSILIGDFNSNAIWDKKNRIGNHSDVVAFLNNKSIHSLYHQKNNTIHGEELQPTLYLLKNKEKPYHIDYCFCSEELISEETTIKIGKFKDWIKFSDHMPIIINNMAMQ